MPIQYRRAWWRLGRVEAFWPEGRGFESCSSRRVGTLGSPSLTVVCGASACKLQHSVNCCGRERFWNAHAVRSAIEMDQYNTIQWKRNRSVVIHCTTPTFVVFHAYCWIRSIASDIALCGELLVRRAHLAIIGLCREGPFRFGVHQHRMISPLNGVPCWWPVRLASPCPWKSVYFVRCCRAGNTSEYIAVSWRGAIEVSRMYE